MKSKKCMTIILLVALLVSGNMFSCGQTVEQAEVQETVNTTDTVVSEETTFEEAIANQYADVDYGGDDFQFLSPAPGGWPYFVVGQEMNEIHYDTTNGEVYNDAVYTRNLHTEELLNINITTNYTPTNFFEFSSVVEKLVLAGDTTTDAALGGLNQQITLASSGHLSNLFEIDSLDVKQSWFDQNIIDNYGYKGEKLYCITGALNIFDDLSVPVIYYGKDILNEHGLEDPSKLVKEGKWTIDNMMTMAETVTVDLNGDGTITLKDDSYGLLDNTGVMIHMMEATGNTMTKQGDDGVPYINTLTETYADAAEFVFMRVVSNDAVHASDNYEDMTESFMTSRSLFYYELLASIYMFREMDTSFSLLPLPKLNEAQERYVAPVNSVWCSTLSVPVCVEDPERTGTVLNVLNAYSVNTVETALYDLLLGSKLVRDEETTVMIDYALENKQYCWGNGYSWSSSISSVLNKQVNSKTFTVASGMQQVRTQVQTDFDTFLTGIFEK